MTRLHLKEKGFDLSKPITWEDDSTGVRYFRQDVAPTLADRLKHA